MKAGMATLELLVATFTLFLQKAYSLCAPPTFTAVGFAKLS